MKIKNKKSKKKIKINKNIKLGGANHSNCSQDNDKIKFIICHGQTIVGEHAECVLPENCNVITCTNPGKILYTCNKSEQEIFDYLINIGFDLKNVYSLKKPINDYVCEVFSKDNYSDETINMLEIYNSETDIYIKEEIKELKKKKVLTPSESEDYDALLNSGLIDFKCHMGGEKGNKKMTMNNICLSFKKKDSKDRNGLLCYKELYYENYKSGNKLKIKDEFLDISNFTGKEELRLDEFLKIFNNKGTFIFFCCRELNDDIFMDETTYEVIRNLSGLPQNIELRNMTHTNCSVCGNIINYVFDNSAVDLPNECYSCNLLDDFMKEKRIQLKKLINENKVEKKNFEMACIDLIKRFQKKKNLIEKKKKKDPNNSRFNRIIKLNTLNLNKILGLVNDIESEIRLIKLTEENEMKYERIERKIGRCHDLISKNITKLDKIK